MVDSADMKVEEETSNKLLEMIIELCIRDRCHSFGKPFIWKSYQGERISEKKIYLKAISQN